MLSKEMREHLEHNWAGVKKETRTVYVSRLKTDARQMLGDLALVAKKLPEKHLGDVFTADTVVPFVISLIEMPKGFNPQTAKGDEKKRMERAGRLCRNLLGQMSSRGDQLAWTAKGVLRMARTEPEMLDLQALLIGDERFQRLPKPRVHR